MLLFLLCFLLQLAAWGFLLRPAFRLTPPLQPRTAPPPISLIVCFRNEAPRLDACLRALLQQRHPNFEIIAVDDNSTDDSAAIVRRLAHHQRLRYLRAGPTRPGKKDALTQGIRAARHERILLTDADCQPTTDQWATTMAHALDDHADLALGVSLYRRADGSPLNHWQIFESVYVALQYLGFARWGMPYMGVGRNLAYKKSTFEAAGGFASHAQLPGGDDDLLVGSVANKNNTALVTYPTAWTLSEPQTSWGAYWRQKRRHQSAGLHYRVSTQVLLTTLGLSHGLFFLLGLWGLFSSWWLLALTAYLLRLPLVLSALRARLHKAAAYPQDAVAGEVAGALSIPRAILFDALLAPYYLVLTMLSCLPARRW